jgi:hypothetical protein
MIAINQCKMFPDKLSFPDKDAALIFAFRRTFSPEPPTDTKVLYVYQCPSCHLVHLTKKFQGIGSEAVYALAI